MITTTVVWASNPDLSTEEQSARIASNTQELYDAAANLAGETYREFINQELNEDKTEMTVTRSWPDLAAAQAWVDLVLAKGAKSAQVNPE